MPNKAKKSRLSDLLFVKRDCHRNMCNMSPNLMEMKDPIMIKSNTRQAHNIMRRL